MAAIQNERTLRLQATVPRIIPVPIPIDQVEGLPEALENAGNGAKRLALRSNVATFFNTTPASATLTASREGGLTGAITWSVIAGTATLAGTGDGVRTVAASSIPIGGYAMIQAACGGFIATTVLSRTSVLAAQSTVDLASQITGMLAVGNVNGIGALGLLSSLNLSNNALVSGALNGMTQVTNLGALAYAEGIAASQIGAGTLAAGVIYAGKVFGQSFAGETFTGGTFTGGVFRTAVSGARVDINGAFANNFVMFGAGGGVQARFAPDNTGPAGLFLGPTNPLGLQIAGTPDVHIQIGTSGAGGIFRFLPVAALPADRSVGSLCVYNGSLCFANGSHWFALTGVQLT